MTETTRPSWLPSIGDVLFLLALYLMLGTLPHCIFGDGSTGWHLVAGQYILEHGQVPAKDLVSYTFVDKPWVAYEWLFDAFIAALEKVGGLRLVAVACCASIATMFLLLYKDCRRNGCHFVLTLVLCSMGVFVSAIHWLARPHLVTWFGVYIFARCLNEFFEQKISAKKLWLFLGLTMLVWVNCHPAFIMGFAILLIYLFCDLVVWLKLAAGEAKNLVASRLKGLVLALLIVAVATLINPYGIKLHEYIVQYLGQTSVIAATDEFSSPVFHGQLQPTCLELLFFALATGLVVTSVRPSLPTLMTVLAFVHLSLSGVRSMPLFVIVGLPFIGWLWGRNARIDNLLGMANQTSNKFVTFMTERFHANAKSFDEVESICSRHAVPVLAVVILALSCFQDGKLFGKEIIIANFNPKTTPTKTLEALKSNNLDPNRGFNYDNWGGLIRYKTGQRVFIDDRVDFYGEKFYMDYGDIVTMKPNWKELLDKYKIQWILFPVNGHIVGRLRQPDSGWKVLEEDPGSVLFVRENKDNKPHGPL
ncbi:MAG: hypothetical protein K2W95_33680 [Candidatus Obscuribacterales bacterium]|nr:hypothetical protein [Candidatus Obscuribacterales bacterium]